jgi:nucleotide-binding universal stress UspA family protein
VLASRAEGNGGAIVAATDLSKPDFPVLTKAASLATVLGKELVTVHNAGPLSALASVVVLPNVVISGGVSEGMRRESLARATTGLPVAATPAVRTEYHAADGILKEARSRNASLIVVGTHRRSWLERALSRSVAQRVVDEARRSVLVTPMADGVDQLV